MRPIPAPRLGDTHGLLRAINQRERLRVDEFITEFSIEELFPPGLENALGRTRQFVSFARSAGLLNEDRGSVELTEIGKRYVRAGDEAAVFDVAPDQAEWLRRQLRERHMTDSIYHGAAIGLSLYASNPPDFRVSMLDFGRALAHLGRAGWDNEHTLESQGERYTTFLRDLELIDDECRLTETGTQAKGELTLPIHMSLRDLAGQLNPGGPEGAASEGEAEWAARAGTAAEEEPTAEAEPAPPAEEPEPVASADDDDDEGEEYEEVRGGEPPAPAEPGRPVPPSDIWETAAPDETTRAYSAIKPEQAAAAAVESSADEPEAAPITSGDPLAGPAEAEPEPEEAPAEGPPAAVEAGDPLGAEAGDPLADPADPEPEPEEAPAEGPPAAVDAGDPLGAGAAGAEAGDPLTGVAAPAPEAGDPLTAGAAAPESGDPLAAGAAASESGDPLAAGAAASESGDPLAAGAAASESGDQLAAAAPAVPDATAPAESADPLAGAAPAAPDAGEPVAAPAGGTPEAPGPVPAPADVAPAPEIADAAPPAASTREPSGFLDLAAVRAAAEESGLKLPDSVYAGLIAALASGKHLVLSGPAGSGKTTLALAIAKAAVQSGRSAGAALATASPGWTAHDTVGRVGEGGFSQGHVLAAAGKKKWLLIDEIDRADLDQALGDLSSFLAGLPLSLPDGSREVAAPADWRVVATRDTGRGPLEASPALLRRFAQVHLPRPERADLEQAIDAAAGDPTAAAAVKRLLAADLPGLGAGVFIDAAHHAAERNALSPASDAELAREVLAAYVAPHLHAELDRLKDLEESL
jgi:AAA domain (dynein-related subfamily)